MKQESYNGVYWSAEDLIGCKQALNILLSKGVSLETLKTLNFGALNVEAVIEEETRTNN